MDDLRHDATSNALVLYCDVSLSGCLLSSHACTNHIGASAGLGSTSASVCGTHGKAYDGNGVGGISRTPEVNIEQPLVLTG